MQKLAVQFYMTPTELKSFVIEQAVRQRMTLVEIGLKPFYVNAHSGTTAREEHWELPDRIALFFDAPVLAAHDWNAFLDDNPHGLFIETGRIVDKKLSQSFLAGQTVDDTLMKRWKSISMALRKETQSGVWVLNPKTKAQGYYRQFRYSKGALQLFDEGFEMMPPAGTNVVLLRAPENVRTRQP